MRDTDLIFLLGAGASKEAGIKITSEMISEIETNLLESDWGKYKKLYYYIKSSILYAKGLKGKYDSFVNIEDFMVVLTELLKKEENTVYPFISNWNYKLIELAGKDFENIDNFEREIREQLIEVWINIKDYSKASYFRKFKDLQSELLQRPLKIFSLNYDMCIEQSIGNKDLIELGFDENKEWNSNRFIDLQDTDKIVHLYKLHGSIDWHVINGMCKKCDVPTKDCSIIFGEKMKLQPIDPYFFMASELRKYLSDANILVSIGYSFGDDYINKMIKQAISNNSNLFILDVSNVKDDNSKQNRMRYIIECVGIKPDNINIVPKTAKEFMETELIKENFDKIINRNNEF